MNNTKEDTKINDGVISEDISDEEAVSNGEDAFDRHQSPKTWKKILSFISRQEPATYPYDVEREYIDDVIADGKPQKKSSRRLRVKLLKPSRQRVKVKKHRFRYVIEKIRFFFFRQTSPTHRQDAEEKYWILWRDIESAMHAKAIELKFNSYAGFKNKTPEEVESVFRDFYEFSTKPHSNTHDVEAFRNLLLYARILSRQPLGLLNKASALNMMWRDITFLRSRILLDPDIIGDESLPLQLEFLRLESARISPSKEEGLEEMCHNTALEMVDAEEQCPSGGKAGFKSNHRARKTLVALFAKLNQIRLNDINVQLRIKKIYNVAFILLLTLSILLLHLDERLTSRFVPYWVAYDQFLATIELSAPLTWVAAPMDFAIFLLQNSLLFYIFFAGLLGGIFSTVMKLRSKEVNISDIYLRSYLLTKPIVGALSATILYIIIKSNIVALDLGQLQIIDQISNNSHMLGPLGFSFGFIMGFSERIILPTVKTETSK